MVQKCMNLIPNADFSRGELGELPDGWSLFSPQPYLTPNFSLSEYEGRKALTVTGNGNDSCVGWLTTSFPMEGGQTYCLKARFRAAEDVNPYKNLLFSFWVDRKFNDGIFEFSRTSGDEFVGEGKFFIPGDGTITGEVRMAYRLHAGGHVHIHEISLEQTDPIPERNVRIACVKGYSADISLWERVIDRAAAEGADLVLLPETFTGDDAKKFEQRTDGESPSMMERMAKKHRIYVAGSFIHRDAADGHLYNTSLLFDREGNKLGRYDKIHPYSPELLHDGISPGREVPVFQTDFGTVGMIICYDYWFTDVAELLALKGAEIILFPNAGHYRSIIPARAIDNGVRIVSSSMYGSNGVWDTSGADVEAPELDPTRHANNDRTFKDVFKCKVDHIEMLLVTLDLNQSPSAHNWGGPMMSAPGGRRNRREQRTLLYDEIEKEMNRRSLPYQPRYS